MLQPMPESCPVPRGVVTHLGGYIGDQQACIVLWRDGKQITIGIPDVNKRTLRVKPSDPTYECELFRAQMKEWAYYLEIIQSLLPYIAFGKTNFGCLVKDRNDNYFVKYKKQVFGTISTPPWATLIPEYEIEYTVWGTCSDRRGIWRNKKVDIQYGWSKLELWAVAKSMEGYKTAQGLDLTYEVYGHLINDDQEVIGLVSEASSGRMIRPSDKALVYAAIAKLQKAGCLYIGCLTNRFMIQDGAVRLIELNCIIRYNDRNKLEQDAKRMHWEELAQLFQEFEEYGEYGNERRPPNRLIASWKDIEYVLPKISPEYPIPMMLRVDFFSNHFIEPWKSHLQPLAYSRSIKQWYLRTGRHRRFALHVPLGKDDSEDTVSPDTERRNARAGPLSIASRDPLLRVASSYHHPYSRSNPYKSSGRITFPDDEFFSIRSSTSSITLLSSAETLKTRTSTSKTLASHDFSANDSIPTGQSTDFDDEAVARLISPAVTSVLHDSGDYVDAFFDAVTTGNPSIVFGINGSSSYVFDTN